MQQAVTQKDRPTYCLGMEAIKSYGLEKWRKDFFMPFPRVFYYGLFERVLSAYAALFKEELSEEVESILSVIARMVPKICHTYNLSLTEAFCVDRESRLILSDGPSFDGRETERIFSYLKGRRPINSVSALKNWAIYTISFGRPNSARFAGPLIRLEKRFAKKGSYRLRPLDIRRLADPEYGIPDKLMGEIDFTIKRLRGALLSLRDDFGSPSVSEGKIESMFSALKNEMVLASRLYLSARERFHREKKGSLFVAGTGNLIVRVIAKAFQDKGGVVTGFEHGNVLGLFYDPGYVLNDFLISDKFIASTDGLEGFFRKLKDRYSYLPSADVAIGNADDDFYFNRWREERGKPAVDKVKKVMYIESPMNPVFPARHNTLYYPLQLELSLRVLEALKKRGYYVMMKIRSSRLKETEAGGIYRDYADEIVGGKFEEAAEAADAYIFPHLFTTTLGHVLPGHKRIVYLLYEEERFIPKRLELLNRRCNAVRCNFDERQRIVFNENELVEAVEKSSGDYNTDFLREYLVSERNKEICAA